MTLPEHWRFPRDVSGWLTESEGKSLAEAATAKTVLEVGSYQGRSTLCMAQTADHVHSVDHHKGDADSGKGGTLPALEANLGKWHADNVTLHVMPFAEFKTDTLFDMAFIDAAHDAESVAHDAVKALALVKPGGKVAFHDWDTATVKRGVAAAFPRQPEKVVDRTAWFTTPLANIEVCIPSRDGLINDDVLMRAHAACQHAASRGINCELTRVTDRYTVATCRNRGVAGFLARTKSHLLFIDDDVLIPNRTLSLLAQTAIEYPKAIVCGCVPSVRINEAGEIAPYVQVRRNGEWLTAWPTGTVDAEVCGGGCMMIPRALFEVLEFPWFRWPETYKPGLGIRAITDDGDFCERARAAGYQVMANGLVRCGHRKELDVAALIPSD